MEQELLSLAEHLSSPPGFCGVRVTRSLVLWVFLVDHCLILWNFSFGHCVVYPSSIYVFWLPLWYLQNLLTSTRYICFYLAGTYIILKDDIIMNTTLHDNLQFTYCVRFCSAYDDYVYIGLQVCLISWFIIFVCPYHEQSIKFLLK